ncbi:complement factor B-like [Mixophyes fleayi]|uniref:complement factor B-like n=1 Tax=Mixophyes fleayi TaxID=3061075 RepID=UPI003F4DB83B
MCRMLLLLLLSHIAMSIADPEALCDLSKVAITGGNYTVSNGGNIGSTVEYSCPKGMYPYPAKSRACGRNLEWTNGKYKASCKVVECPRPVSFEGGDYGPPAIRYFVGDVLTFECYGGFTMFGPANHTCQENGKWSGELTICDDQEGQCPNPGIPFGAMKVGTSYKIENKVTYECQNKLKMFGSEKRTCMENKRWSGTEPSCRNWYTFDTPEEVAVNFASSLSQTFESSDLNKVEDTSNRKLVIKEGGLVNIFMIMDASKSVGEENFNLMKAICEIFIEKVSSFDILPRYAVVSYASFSKIIVRLSDDDSANADEVIEKIKEFQYSEHDDKQGTNTRAALLAVHEMLSLENLRDQAKLHNTSNIILLMTDGKHNMGGDPTLEVDKIKDLLDVKKNGDKILDVYVFGLGEDISLPEINDIASKKDGEKHVFLMENTGSMKEAFQGIIDDAEAFQMCGLSKDLSGDINNVVNEDDEDLIEKYPWIAKILISRPGAQEKCKGSIVSKNFILTAAHCFHLDEQLHYITVDTGDARSLKVKDLYRHDKYAPDGKLDKKVAKSFDYDMALVELTRPLKFSRKVRPICLPCTTGTSWALRQRGKSVTCNDHKKALLNKDLVRAMFITEVDAANKLRQMNVQIKRGNKRNGCLADAKKVKEFKDVPNIEDVVTENFLCTGGTEPQLDPQACKGDSGGPLIVPFKNRYIQVGIISWGTVISCKDYVRYQVPSGSRDFHADVFQMLDWIKKVVKEDLQFL